MVLTKHELEELSKALADIEYGRVEILIHAGEMVSLSVTKVTKNKVLTKHNRCVVNDSGKRT